MNKPLFALASVSVVSVMFAGVFVGCSDDSSGAAADDGGSADARRDVTPIVDPTDGNASGSACLSPDVIDVSTVEYHDPNKPITGACTADELDALTQFFDTAFQTQQLPSITDWRAEVGETCGNCAFGDIAGDTWAPILYDADQDTYSNTNRGGCMATVSGKTSCGKAYQQWFECLSEACSSCTTDQDYSSCLDDPQLQDKICKDATDAVLNQCGTKVATYEQQCKSATYIFEGPIRVACIYGGATRPKDAGADAADSGDADADAN